MLAHSSHVMTLANSIIGVGILAMPFCFQKCGIILSLVLLVISNWITRICCHYLIKCALITRRKSFEFLGFYAFGVSGKLLVELCIIGYLLGTCITYFVVVGDLGPQIFADLFPFDVDHRHLRSIVMVGVTLFCILPLGMLKNVDSLSTVCAASIGFYICLIIKIICECEEHVLANDWTEKVKYWEPAGVLQCLPIISMALSCQMQLFEVLETVNNQNLEKLNNIVRHATWICTAVYVAMGFFGYVAFCTQNFSGNILMNLPPSLTSDVIKLGFVLSVAFSFPLVIFPCRASIYSLLYRKGHGDASDYIPEPRFRGITCFIVGFSLCIALMIPSVELIIGLVGSTIGVAICIMFPASCFRKVFKKDSTERTLAQFILVCGFCFMILGTYANLNAIDEKSSGAHFHSDMEDKLRKAPALPSFTKIKVEDALDKGFQGVENQVELSLKSKDTDEQAEKVVPVVHSEPAKKQEFARKLPPLPVDEQHAKIESNDNNKANKAENLQMTIDEKVKVKAQVPVVRKPYTAATAAVLQKNKADLKDSNADVDVAHESIPKTAAIVSELPQQHQRTLNVDAIKKDDEMAAEEQGNKKVAPENQAELNELKEAKALIERTVDELKQELAKQNEETQNLVVEKLGAMVEKVEQIERKVQKTKEQQSEENPKLEKLGWANPNQEAPGTAAMTNKEQPAQQNQSELMMKLSNNAVKQVLQKPSSKNSKEHVYEPLSYKTGEIIEHAKKDNAVKQRLPLPLAVLFNASQTLNIDTKLQEQAKVNLTSVAGADEITNVKDLKVDISSQESNKKNAESNKPSMNSQAKDEHESVDAMRREILQVDDEIQEKRVKRESALDTLQTDIHHLCSHEENCRQIGLLPKQGIGRDLKSIDEIREANNPNGTKSTES